jgi:hypothetical protein
MREWKVGNSFVIGDEVPLMITVTTACIHAVPYARRRRCVYIGQLADVNEAGSGCNELAASRLCSLDPHFRFQSGPTCS